MALGSARFLAEAQRGGAVGSMRPEIANGLGRRRLCQEFGNRLAKFAIGYGRDRRAQRAVAGTSFRMRTSSAQKGNSISSRVWLWRSASSAATGVKKRKPRQRPKTRRGLRAFTSFPRLPHLKSITPMSRLGSTRVVSLALSVRFRLVAAGYLQPSRNFHVDCSDQT